MIETEGQYQPASPSKAVAAKRTVPQPLPDNIRSVQPGGGVCYQVELAWGRCRRWWLRTFRPGYVQAMRERRQGGGAGGAPACGSHEVIDPRDLKYCRNVCDYSWPEADDPFRWRRSLPVAPWGAAELALMGGPLLVLTLFLACSPWWYGSPWPWWYLSFVPAAGLALVLYFFRNPRRKVPQEPGLWVSPADGTIAEITPLEHDDFIGGPAVRIGIFLSIFNVHLNRAPAAARVIALRYSPGEFLNALRPESALRNENMWIGLEEDSPASAPRRFVVRQISGAIARRIVCDLKPGDDLPRGHVFGMIKLGSRTELIVPQEPGLEIKVRIGQKVQAGGTIMVAAANSR
jgi:phosphatidylserine decarboxylase